MPRLSRPQRRAVTAALERSLAGLLAQGGEGSTLAWEALRRHGEAFKRVLARLHVHERPRDWPHVCALAGLLSAGGEVDGLEALTPAAREVARRVAAMTPGEPTRARTLPGGVERALAGGGMEEAVALLGGRPGLLGRALDRLLRLESGGGPEAPVTLAGLERAAPRLTAALVAGLHAHLGRRDAPDLARHFRSRGQASTRALGDTRLPLDRGLIGRAQALLKRELLRRGAAAPELGTLEIDHGMLGVRLAASARASSGGLEGLAPGSRLPLTPAGTEPARTARLFLHWAQRERAGSIDLDLSAMAYGPDGRPLLHCSFSSLKVPGMVHSGDLRSAPLPVGATEYIDLDLGALRRAGAARVLATVHSYTSVPFSRMERASCGLMSRVDTGEGAREMDPATVRLRFDLRGEQTSCLLLAIDLGEPGGEQVIFLELAGDRGGYQVVERDRQADLALQVGRAARGLPLTLLLAAHAARAGRVVCGDTRLQRQEGEGREAFAERVHLALLDLVEGRAVRGDPGEAPRGPTLRVADRAGEVLRPGDTLVSLQAGVMQPAGVRLLGLRGLLEGL